MNTETDIIDADAIAQSIEDDARELTPEQVRCAGMKLAARTLYDVQTLRIQLQLRIARLVRDEIMSQDDADEQYGVSLSTLQQAEKELEDPLWDAIKDQWIVSEYLIRVKGIGVRIAGVLVANLMNMERFPTRSALYAYCGVGVVDGRCVKREKGVKANWNSELKTTLFKFAQSIVKCGGPFRELYDRYKARINERVVNEGGIIWKRDPGGSRWMPSRMPLALKDAPLPTFKAKEVPEWTEGRIKAMSERYVAKMLLSFIWEVWRTHDGLPTTEPYAIAYLGHSTRLDPWAFVEPKKVAKRRAVAEATP
jgi:hypothetical protein